MVKVQYRCAHLEDKKAVIVVRTGKFNYAVIMTVTKTTVRFSHVRGATAKKLVVKMHKQYCI